MAWKDTRPMSPHLDIYRLPLSALISICHRGTGAVLSLGAIGLVVVLTTAAAGADTYAWMGALLGSVFGKLVMFGFTAALYLHLCNGVRHLFWDVGYGYSKEEVAKSSRWVLIATGVLTLITWIAALT